MSDIQLGIYHLAYEEVTDLRFLQHYVYPNIRRNYYWSDDFSPEYYIAQAKAGFIAVTDIYKGKELLLPEMQFSYALLHFEDLHIGKKVRRIIKNKAPTLQVTTDITRVAQAIRRYHHHCWLTTAYLETLLATQHIRDDFQILAFYIEEEKDLIAGEIGYIIGNTYTSLSGFSSKDPSYRSYGTIQLVLLAQYLQKEGFSFWNLGQTYMPYKFQLGAKRYDREQFLKLWYENC